MLEIPLAHFIDAQNWSVYRNPHSSMSYTPQIVSRWSVKHSISTACTVYKALLPLSEVFGFCQNFCQHWVKAILYVLAEFNFWIPIFASTAAKATFRLVRYYPWADFREVQGNQADSTCSFSLRIIYHRFPPENLVVQDPQQWGCATWSGTWRSSTYSRHAFPLLCQWKLNEKGTTTPSFDCYFKELSGLCHVLLILSLGKYPTVSRNPVQWGQLKWCQNNSFIFKWLCVNRNFKQRISPLIFSCL